MRSSTSNLFFVFKKLIEAAGGHGDAVAGGIEGEFDTFAEIVYDGDQPISQVVFVMQRLTVRQAYRHDIAIGVIVDTGGDVAGGCIYPSIFRQMRLLLSD